MNDTATKPANMLEIHRYFAGGSLDSVPAKLTDDEKKAYGIAAFRKDWEALSESDKNDIKVGIGNGTFTY